MSSLFRWLARGLLVLLLLLAPRAEATAQAATATAAPAPGQPEVYELLRLGVPRQGLACWRRAEAGTWQRWLERQGGFAGRQLFWDAEREEGLVLIGWARAADWHRIPEAEVAAAQARFEAEAHRCLVEGEALAATRAPAPGPVPYPLLSAAALEPQGAEGSER